MEISEYLVIPWPDRTLLIASGNPHKHDEICRELSLAEGLLLRPSDVESKLASAAPDPLEDGETLLENAIIKATAFSLWSGLPALADDTGLMVDALDGAPGVHAARFAGENATFQDNVDKLLKQLGDLPQQQRGAEFRCVLALCDGDQVILTVEEKCSGSIALEPRGKDGFGYDPVFVPANNTLTFAELTASQKDSISHRGRAVRRFAGLYNELGTAEGFR
ncbi:MAG: RdgB/HAM1 family non-canonical purine NTP pyrophosphatase [Planctomycetota bacterium]|nr:RdgB/HAM1 family non-canonical purine NTP pyrophosphatase [Planctomycetota bacterium]